MTQVRDNIRGQIRSPVRGQMTLATGSGESFHDGISFNARTGRVIVKAPGASPQIGTLASFFTFTGGNQSMYMGPAGLLVASATNTPRIEYDANGNCLGLLMEATRTNLGLHSGDHTNAAWVKTNITSAKTSTGPDGVTNSASRLTATAANGTSLQTVVSASATRDYSVWIRRITGSGNIDLTLDGGVGWTTRSITSLWTRVDITQAAVTNPVFGIRIVTSGDAIDVYGDQMESAAFASSLIPTTTVSVARTADSCIRTLGSEFSATAGTVVVAGRASGGQDAALHQHVYGFDNNTNQEMFRHFRQTTTDNAYFQVQDGGVSQVDFNTSTFVNSTSFKSAVAWALNDAAFSFNGAAVATDPGVTLPTVTQLGIGQAAFQNNTQMNGHILRFDYYPTRLPNNMLQQMSA